MLANPWFWSAACAVALGGTLAARRREWLLGEAVQKPLASTAFIVAAVLHGAAESVYGQGVLAALALSWFGDVFLISRARRFFLMGLVAFLLGHVAYTVAFALRGVDLPWVAAAAVPMALTARRVHAWLRPHVPERMRTPVLAYVVVITVMVTLAFGAFGRGAPWVVPVAATMFWCSDLAVARDRFIATGFVNRLWGLPLYYGAQVLFAWSVSL